MIESARQELEAQLERALRRGEFASALQTLEQLAQRYPEDPSIVERAERLRQALKPEELHRTSVHESAPVPLSAAEEGERLASLGDYVNAAAALRRALKEQPESELIQERLAELYELARTTPSHSPTDSHLPVEPERRLRALLDRIFARRRIVLP